MPDCSTSLSLLFFPPVPTAAPTLCPGPRPPCIRTHLALYHGVLTHHTSISFPKFLNKKKMPTVHSHTYPKVNASPLVWPECSFWGNNNNSNNKAIKSQKKKIAPPQLKTIECLSITDFKNSFCDSPYLLLFSPLSFYATRPHAEICCPNQSSFPTTGFLLPPKPTRLLSGTWFSSGISFPEPAPIQTLPPPPPPRELPLALLVG